MMGDSRSQCQANKSYVIHNCLTLGLTIFARIGILPAFPARDLLHISYYTLVCVDAVGATAAGVASVEKTPG